MSYTIRYGRDLKQETQARRKSIVPWMAGIVMALAVFLCAVWPQGRAILHRLVIPWVNDVTMDAFRGMMEQIQSGITVPAAVLEFCREVIGNAGFPV